MKQTKTNTTQHNSTTNPVPKRIVNWSQYNKALVARGSITLLINRELASPKCLFGGKELDPKKCGRRFIYPDHIIQLIALMRELYRQPLRQVTSTALDLFGLMMLGTKVPDYTTISRRMKDLSVPLGAATYKKGQNLVVLIDSTGLKIMGEGEWTIRKHGKHYARDWRKIHLVIDHASQDIVALETTHADAHDINGLKPLLNGCENEGARVGTVIGDGAYGSVAAHETAMKYGATMISPPTKRSVVHPKCESAFTRNEYIRSIHDLGLDVWKKEVGYHRRSLAETAMYRLKAAFGGSLRSKTEANQITEARLRAKLLNSFNILGLPKYEMRSI